MKYCMDCGTLLVEQYLEHEGMVPFCKHCQKYRFPIFHTAVSLIVCDPEMKKILLIKQYGGNEYILVAGYVNQTEALEEAMIRECQEEIGRKVIRFQYLKSEYFKKSNTLMCNFAVVVDSESLSDVSEWEIEEAAWFDFAQAKENIKQGSLAQKFLNNFLKQMESGNIKL